VDGEPRVQAGTLDPAAALPLCLHREEDESAGWDHYPVLKQASPASRDISPMAATALLALAAPGGSAPAPTRADARRAGQRPRVTRGGTGADCCAGKVNI
jgi:hypothetical protein